MNGGISLSKEFYKKLVNQNGKDMQMLKTLEEMNELSNVIIESFTKKDINIDNKDKILRDKIVEEMSHVLMTFKSLEAIFNISDDEIEEHIEFKKKLIKWRNENTNENNSNNSG